MYNIYYYHFALNISRRFPLKRLYFLQKNALLQTTCVCNLFCYAVLALTKANSLLWRIAGIKYATLPKTTLETMNLCTKVIETVSSVSHVLSWLKLQPHSACIARAQLKVHGVIAVKTKATANTCGEEVGTGISLDCWPQIQRYNYILSMFILKSKRWVCSKFGLLFIQGYEVRWEGWGSLVTKCTFYRGGSYMYTNSIQHNLYLT